jgi:osmoprotectant transport system permease protein
MTGVRDQLGKLPHLLAAHVELTFLALLLGVAFSLPLGVLCARRSVAGRVVLSVVNVLQTVPSLALLASMVALLSSFGFWPALLALFIYSMLPVLRNTVSGIAAVDSDVIEAATALGMSPRQLLFRVELPLAAPLIVAGIRTATVWVVGTATLSTPVGQPSLGNFIFSGLQTRNFSAVLVGCCSAALLALVLDAALSRIEQALSRRRFPAALAWASSTLLALALGSLAPLVRQGNTAAVPVAPAAAHGAPKASGRSERVRIGSKAFTEQYVLAAAAAKLLEGAGLAVDRRESLGSTVAFDALRAGSIDLYVDYSGTLWSNVLGRKGTAPAWRVLDETCGALAERFHVRCLGPLGFENAYAFAMRGDRARARGIKTIGDLARVAATLDFGTDLEFMERPEWSSVERAYGLRFKRVVPFDPAFMYEAVFKGEVDVITAFSSDARVEALGLTVLEDTRRALPPYDAVVLLSASAALDRRIESALDPMLRRIDVHTMRRANLLVDRSVDKRTPDDAAAWLLEGLRAKAGSAGSRDQEQ